MSLWGEELNGGLTFEDELVRMSLLFWAAGLVKVDKNLLLGNWHVIQLATFTDRLTEPWWVWRGMSTFSRLRGR